MSRGSMALISLWLASASPALAQEEAVQLEDAAPQPELPPPGPPPPPEEVHALAREIGSKLRCPVCQGLSVADSQAEAALLMYGRVKELVAQGYTEAQIQDYWVARYGEWVLLEPRGRHWLVWVTPGIGAGVALVWLSATMLRWRREEDEVPLPSDVGMAPKDPYEQRLLAELEER